MATTIKLKNGSGAPLAGDLVQGEPAFDLTNKRLYTEDSGGTVIEVGTTPTSLTTTGTVTFGSLSDGAITITAFVDEDNMVSDSATLVPTQQSVKAYVDSQVTAQDLDFQGDSGGALSIDLDSETLTIAGGTGIDTTGATNTLTVAIDSTVTTLTGTQTLTNKTLTSPVINTGVSGTAVLDDDTFATASATTLATSESIKAYVDAQVDTADQLSELSDVNITTPADGALLFYDTGTTKWIDNVVSGDITIADTGVAAISSGVIVNADVNASAAISVSKTALTAGTGLTLTTDTLSVDASQTQITAVGTIGTGTWQGTAIADAYVADNLTISGGTVDNTVIGGTTAAAGTFTTFTSTGIDDNATSTAITIDASENVGIGDSAPTEKLVVSRLGSDWAGVAPQAITTAFFHSGTTNDSSGSAITIAGGDTATNAIYFSDESDSDIGAIIYSNNDDSMQFRTGNSERMRIDSSGNVGINTTSIDSGVKIHVEESDASLTAATTSSVALFERAGNAGISIGTANTGECTIFFQDTDSATIGRVKYDHADDSLGFWANSIERMRIDSSGNVGIGTDSPDTLLELRSANPILTIRDTETSTVNAESILRLAESGASDSLDQYWDVKATGSSNLDFAMVHSTSGEAMRIDSSGNVDISNGDLHVSELGSKFTLGPTLNASVHSGAGIKASTPRLTFEPTADGQSSRIQFCKTDGTQWGSIYGFNNTELMQFSADVFTFKTSSTDRMRIDSSGNVGIGTTSPSYPFVISDGGNIGFEFSPDDQNTGVNRIYSYDRGTSAYKDFKISASQIIFGYGSSGGNEAMRIDSSGNVIIANPNKLLNDTDEGILFSGSVPGLAYFTRDGGLSGSFSRLNSYGDVIRIVANGNAAGRIGSGGAGALSFYDGAGTTERMRIDSSGNLLVGTTATPTSSAGNIVLENGTAPTASATDGVILYAEDVSSSSELKVRDEAGNITTLSPHNFDLIPQGPSEDMAWSYYSERDGKQINVDMLKAIRVLEKLSGEQLVFEN